MNPKFKDIIAWEQAQLLMQPAFIRVLDNLRKQLENSLWKGTYTEIQDPYPSYLLLSALFDLSRSLRYCKYLGTLFSSLFSRLSHR